MGSRMLGKIQELVAFLENDIGVDVQAVREGKEPFSLHIVLEEPLEKHRVPAFWQDYKLIVLDCDEEAS